MNVGTSIHHFTVKRVRELPEIKARLWEMEHEKNGAQLVWLDRADENKTFSIAFKTTPENDTGVFHIIEHSVLCGSDKFPVKEPFVDLLKSSVQTFLNAITFGDKTVYPVSSRNDKDFLNLVEVYMDAVLHPAIYHKPEIFRQEGWRYELPEGGEPVYQGVVFNEMKGSMASWQSIFYEQLSALLLPDTCYAYNSGGEPTCIPNLSYEEFLASHKKYYHPSNARISLIGSVDLDKTLALIDGYLNEYERLDICVDIPMQQPVAQTQREIPYEIGPDDPEEERYIVCGGRVIGRFDEQKKIFATHVLSDYLAGENDAPLKRAILDAGLGQDLSIEMDDGIQQPILLWAVSNTGSDKIGEIRRTIREKVEKMLREGLDRDRLEACVDNFTFRTRDREGGWGPRGLSEALEMLNTWLYDGDPAAPLLVDETLTALKADMDTGYFEALLRELFLEEGGAELVLVPSKTLGEERRAREAERVAAESALWTPERRAELERQFAALTAWQQSEDSEEAKATIPVLALSDLNDEPERLNYTQERCGETTVLRHALDSEIVYARLFFAASDLSAEELPALALLAELLGKLPTERYSSAELQNRIKQKIGKFSVSAGAVLSRDIAKTGVNFSLGLAFIRENAQDVRALLEELLLRTRFDDRKTLGENIKQLVMNAQMTASAAGQMYGMMRAGAQVTAAGAAQDAMAGFGYANWLKARSQEEGEAQDALLQKLGGILRRIVSRARLTLSLSANAGEAEPWCAIIPERGDAMPEKAAYETLSTRQEGIQIPADIGFAAELDNFKLAGASYCGAMPVLANILNYDFLWNEIRVQGGAYGCGFIARPNGDFGYYTYRDPQPGRSLGIFREAASFIRRFSAEKPDLTRQILGSVSDLDPLRNSEQKMSLAESLYFRGETQEDLARVYRELLATTSDDLLALCGMLDALTEKKHICVVGGQAALAACGEQLSEIQTI